MYVDINTEIMNLVSNEPQVIEDSDEESQTLFISLRRTKKTRCKICKEIMGTYLPIKVPYDTTICIFCEHSIIYSVSSYKKRILQKSKIKNLILKKLHEEIIEFGMRPDRIRNTLLFEFKWNF